VQLLKSTISGDYVIDDNDYTQIKNANDYATKYLGATSNEYADFNFNIAMNMLSAYKGNATSGRSVEIINVAKQANIYLKNIKDIETYENHKLVNLMYNILDVATNAGIGLTDEQCEAMLKNIDESIELIAGAQNLNEWQISSWYSTVAKLIYQLAHQGLLKGSKADFLSALDKIPVKDIEKEDVNSEVDNNYYIIKTTVKEAREAVNDSSKLS